MPRWWFRAAHFALKIIYLIEHPLVRGRLFLDRTVQDHLPFALWVRSSRFVARNRRRIGDELRSFVALFVRSNSKLRVKFEKWWWLPISSSRDAILEPDNNNDLCRGEELACRRIPLRAIQLKFGVLMLSRLTRRKRRQNSAYLRHRRNER